MGKYGEFKKVTMCISHTHMQGHYELTSTYKGKYINAIITDATIYDGFDSSNKREKANALRAAYWWITECYKLVKGRL